jgi:hypothetical protein
MEIKKDNRGDGCTITRKVRSRLASASETACWVERKRRSETRVVGSAEIERGGLRLNGR